MTHELFAEKLYSYKNKLPAIGQLAAMNVCKIKCPHNAKKFEKVHDDMRQTIQLIVSHTKYISLKELQKRQCMTVGTLLSTADQSVSEVQRIVVKDCIKCKFRPKKNQGNPRKISAES